VEQGRIGVATIYLGGGVCGALGASLLQPSLYLVGASAGVYALLTSHLAHLYLVSATKSFSISKNTNLNSHKPPVNVRLLAKNSLRVRYKKMKKTEDYKRCYIKKCCSAREMFSLEIFYLIIEIVKNVIGKSPIKYLHLKFFSITLIASRKYWNYILF